MTLFKRSLDLQQQLRSQLDGLAAPAEGPAALEQSAALDGVAEAVQRLGVDVAKMKAKAQEPDPDKKVSVRCACRLAWACCSATVLPYTAAAMSSMLHTST